jgi:hypothetical protein
MQVITLTMPQIRFKAMIRTYWLVLQYKVITSIIIDTLNQEQPFSNDIFGSNSNFQNYPIDNQVFPSSNNKQGSGEDIEISNSYNFNNPINAGLYVEERTNIPQSFISSFNQVGFEAQDPEEIEAQKRRRAEDEIKLKDLYQRQLNEAKNKNEYKLKAREFIENFNQNRQLNNQNRHNRNIQEEKVFIETRQNDRQSVKTL